MKAAVCVLLVVMACGGDDSESDRLGIGAQCTTNDDCLVDDNQACLTEFSGGYCGRAGCASDADCPVDAACIAFSASENFCFRTCADKIECNANRDADVEANCSSSVTFTDGTQGRKACVPPSGN